MRIIFGVTQELGNLLERMSITFERLLLGIDQELEKINRRLLKMATQADIDALTKTVNDSTAAIVTKIEEETQEVKDFIAAHPELDTSALEEAVKGLEGIAEDVDNILPDAAPEPEPEPEPTPES